MKNHGLSPPLTIALGTNYQNSGNLIFRYSIVLHALGLIPNFSTPPKEKDMMSIIWLFFFFFFMVLLLIWYEVLFLSIIIFFENYENTFFHELKGIWALKSKNKINKQKTFCLKRTSYTFRKVLRIISTKGNKSRTMQEKQKQLK